MHSERLLLGPGPSNPYPEAVEALGRPVLGHLDPEYLDLVAATCDRLRTGFGTRNRLTLPVSGTGSAGMEACLANLLEPGDAAMPSGLDDAAARGALRERYGIEVGGGLGPLAGAGWRIGLMGHNAGDRAVAALLGAVRGVLS